MKPIMVKAVLEPEQVAAAIAEIDTTQERACVGRHLAARLDARGVRAALGEIADGALDSLVSLDPYDDLFEAVEDFRAVYYGPPTTDEAAAWKRVVDALVALGAAEDPK